MTVATEVVIVVSLSVGMAIRFVGGIVRSIAVAITFHMCHSRLWGR